MSGQLSGNQERAAQIAALNDEFRKAGPTPDWVPTLGALALFDFPGLQ